MSHMPGRDCDACHLADVVAGAEARAVRNYRARVLRALAKQFAEYKGKYGGDHECELVMSGMSEAADAVAAVSTVRKGRRT